jgi:hypothetical protein
MKLEIEPILVANWGISLAQLLPPPVWDSIRKEVYEAYRYTCALCGEMGRRLECHEKWLYDDRKKIQKLSGFQCLCPNCHKIKHWGRTYTLAKKSKDGELIESLIKHFCEVNSCSRKDFEEHKLLVLRKAKQRAKYRYRVDFGAFEPRRVTEVWLKKYKKELKDS